MFRYLRLYLYFLRFSFSRAMEFRIDFFFRIAMDAVWYVVQIAFFWLIFRHTSLLGGWTFDQMVVFAAAYMFVDAVHMTLFSNNLWFLPTFINRGDLDYYIVRPVSSLYFLSLRDFAANSFCNLLMASGILFWAIARFPDALGPDRIVLFLLFLAAGCFLNYTLNMLCLIPVFWTQAQHGLHAIYWSLMQYGTRPHQIFEGWLRRAITTILPFALISSFPTHILFDGLTLERVLHTFVVIGCFFGATVFFWGRGLRAYASASS